MLATDIIVHCVDTGHTTHYSNSSSPADKGMHTTYTYMQYALARNYECSLSVHLCAHTHMCVSVCVCVCVCVFVLNKDSNVLVLNCELVLVQRLIIRTYMR